MFSGFWSGVGNRCRAVIDAMRIGVRSSTHGWRFKLAVALAFAAAVVIGIVVAVLLGGIIAGVVG